MKSTEKPPPVERRVLRGLDRDGISRGASFVVAFSGGPDSTSLLACLKALAPLRDYGIVAVYVDHRLRDDAELARERDTVVAIAAALEVQLRVVEATRGELTSADGRDRRGGRRSVEAAARRFRYRSLERIRRELGYDFIATAHHADDQAETVLMRVLQGSSAAGIGGIRYRRGRIVRPFLRLTQTSVRDYLARSPALTRFVPSEDSTNRNEKLLRNAVRRRIVPVVAAVFPGYRRAVSAHAKKGEWADRFIEREARTRVVWSVFEGGAEVRTNALRFYAESEIIRLYALHRALILLFGDASQARIPFRFLNSVIHSNGRGVSHGHGLAAGTRGESFFLKQDIVQPGKRGYLVLMLGHPLDVPIGRSWRLVARTIEGRREAAKLQSAALVEREPDGVFLAENAIAPPLLLRSRRPGDSVLTAAGTKSLKKLLSEHKIPEMLRDSIPVIEDRRGVLAVLMGPFGGRNVLARFVPGSPETPHAAPASPRDKPPGTPADPEREAAPAEPARETLDAGEAQNGRRYVYITAVRREG